MAKSDLPAHPFRFPKLFFCTCRATMMIRVAGSGLCFRLDDFFFALIACLTLAPQARIFRASIRNHFSRSFFISCRH
jgi:hypothetical protein